MKIKGVHRYYYLKMVSNLLFFLLLIGLITINSCKVIAFLSFQCIEDRVLSLQNPVMIGKEIFSITTSKNIKPPTGELNIIINTYKKTLTLYVNGKSFKTYPVAIGKPSTKSPVGEWAIIGKDKDWGGGFGTRWLRLNVPWGIYGIHGTNKPWLIGNAVSHGCIRMYNSHVEELFRWVPLKTRVKIIGKRLPIKVNRVLKPGQSGLAVMQLQDNLVKFGFEPGYLDARYGPATEQAIKELEVQFGFKVDGIADWNVLYLLELPGD